jgi:hypothetical protein
VNGMKIDIPKPPDGLEQTNALVAIERLNSLPRLKMCDPMDSEELIIARWEMDL